jgi:hypothetical protein
MKTILFATLIFYSSICLGASEWIPYIESVPTYPTVEVQRVPSVVLSNIIVNPNVVRYQWVPMFINRPVIISESGCFIKRQHIIYQPTIEWIIQPVYR